MSNEKDKTFKVILKNIKGILEGKIEGSEKNDILKELETISSTTLKPVIINSIILILFSLIFIILNNIISKKKRQF